jgi:hypothetical protein
MTNCSSPDGWEWLTPDFYSGAYDRFIRLRWSIDPFPGEDLHLDPRAFVLSPEEQKKISLSFELLRLSIQRIVGEVNGFKSDIFDLKTWEKILPGYEDVNQKVHLLHQFVDPLSKSCLLAPYAVKNQIIFSGTQIAILFEKGKRHLKIPKNGEIAYPTFEKWAGTWSDFPALAEALSALNDEKIKTLRDQYTHRIPPRIEVGIVPNYRFERDGQNLRIYPQVDEPLTLSDTIEASVMQHRACVTAVQTFWHMLKAKVAAV